MTKLNEILVLIAYTCSHSIKVHVQLPSGAKYCSIGLGLHLCSSILCVSHEGSDGSAWVYRLI